MNQIRFRVANTNLNLVTNHDSYPNIQKECFLLAICFDPLFPLNILVFFVLTMEDFASTSKIDLNKNNSATSSNGYKFVSVKTIPSISSFLSENSPSTSFQSTLIPRRIRSYTVNEKLQVLKYAKENSINAANKHFNIDRKCIRQWKKNEQDLLSLQLVLFVNSSVRFLEHLRH